MKYDFSECNNLQFKAKWDEEKVITGYLKVAKEGEECVGYVFSDWKESESLDSSLQIVTRNYERCEIIEEFSEWAEKHDLEIVPRDPETYTDWKVGDRVMDKDTGGISIIAAKLGDIVFLLNDNNAVTSTCTAMLTKDYTLVLTDYEKELLNAQKQEENKKKECPFKEEDKVLVRDEDSSWAFDEFLYYVAESHYPYKCVSSSYEQCIPLNEHTWKLLGTMDEYKEEE